MQKFDLILTGKRNHQVLTTEKKNGLLTEEIFHFRGAVAPVAFTLFRLQHKTQVVIPSHLFFHYYSNFLLFYLKMMKIVITRALRVTKREDEKPIPRLSKREEMLLRKAIAHYKT